MTKASASRVARRQDTFIMPPEAMLSEQIDLSDPFRMVLGLIHPEHEPYPLVAVWNGGGLRHLTEQAARTYAEWIEAESGEGDVLKPVSEALVKLANRIAEIAANLAMSRQLAATVH